MRYWTTDETAALRTMLLDGWSDERIALKLGRSPRSVLGRRQRLKLVKRRMSQARRRWTVAEHSQIAGMLSLKVSVGDIAIALGRPTGAVYDRIAPAAYPPCDGVAA